MSQCNASPQGPEKKILPFLYSKEIADEEFLKTFETSAILRLPFVVAIFSIRPLTSVEFSFLFMFRHPYYYKFLF